MKNRVSIFLLTVVLFIFAVTSAVSADEVAAADATPAFQSLEIIETIVYWKKETPPFRPCFSN